MKDEMMAFLELADRNLEKCPWIKGQTFERHLEKLLLEMEELKTAHSKKDWKNAQEELGDVLWDVIILMRLAEREGKFNAKDTLKKAQKKIEFRKPWLISGEEITKEEAMKIWKERKNPKH